MALHRSAFIACFLLLTACSQAEDEACQVNSDCEDGLVCSISGLRGTCRPAEEIEEDSGTPDSGNEMVSPDASVRDGSVDVQDGSVDQQDGSTDSQDGSVDAEVDAATVEPDGDAG
jgi:hypothetical protein